MVLELIDLQLLDYYRVLFPNGKRILGGTQSIKARLDYISIAESLSHMVKKLSI
jgi:hypothetical protein